MTELHALLVNALSTFAPPNLCAAAKTKQLQQEQHQKASHERLGAALNALEMCPELPVLRDVKVRPSFPPVFRRQAQSWETGN